MRIARRSLACHGDGRTARPGADQAVRGRAAHREAAAGQNVLVRDASARTRTARLAAPGEWIAFFVYAPVRGRPIEAKATVAVTSPYAWLFNHASGSGVAQLVQKKPRLAI